MTTDLMNRARSHGHVVMAATARASARWSLVLLAGAMLLAWSVTYAAGGSHTVLPHLFYLPIVAAASRFGHRGAVVGAACAGVLAGPAMPLDVDAGTSQLPISMLLRAVMFVAVGLTVAFLKEHSLSELTAIVADRRLRSEMERAVERGEFGVVYQPLFDLVSRDIVGVEALVRWHHPERGTIAPDQFICAAERTGAILPIGLHVLRAAAAQVAHWQRCYGCDIKVAVNLSPRQLDDDDLVDKVAVVLAQTGLPPSALQLEVTETSLLADITSATRSLDELRALGVGIAIDDFGTGQSSLAYLHRFHADVIKIDRSFVQALECDSHAKAVAQGVVRLSTSLGAITVAEGIETRSQAEILRVLSCDVGQGFFFARPTDATTVDALLAERHSSPRTAVHSS